MRNIITSKHDLQNLTIEDVKFIENFNTEMIHPVLLLEGDMIAVFDDTGALLDKKDLSTKFFGIDDLYNIGVINFLEKEDIAFMENFLDESIDVFDEIDLVRLRDALNRRFPC